MIEEKKKTRSKRYEEETSKQVSYSKKETTKIKKDHPILKKILITIFFIFLLITLYSMLIGNKIIDINEYKIESSIIPDSFHGIKIVHFSDIHYGTTINKKQLDKIVKKINELNPDIIVFTGDLIDKNIIPNKEIKEEIIESLNNLECSLYKYAIYGDEDLQNDYYNEIINKSNFTLLEDSSTLLYYKENTPIEITGYNPIETSPNYTILTNYVEEQDTTNYFKIVLTHEPDSIDKFINYNPNLVLSGHTLGGLIKIPFIKPLLLPNNTNNYYEEYYKVKETDIFISNGLGTSGINSRLNNHPSINLYRIYKAK
ncbi:MAG: metallophosphoesterase [Candidatus Coprovivens sp.]